MFEFVTPAKATEGSAEIGVQSAIALRQWIPAFAGMTGSFNSIGPEQQMESFRFPHSYPAT
jgi:hypothetical protein